MSRTTTAPRPTDRQSRLAQIALIVLPFAPDTPVDWGDPSSRCGALRRLLGIGRSGVVANTPLMPLGELALVMLASYVLTHRVGLFCRATDTLRQGGHLCGVAGRRCS